MRIFTPEHRARLSAAQKRRYDEGRSPYLKRGDAGRPGSLNHMWKGEEAGYQSIHNWLRRNRKKTGVCQMCGDAPDPIQYLRQGKPVTRIATDWANISGEMRREDESDWLELCRKCHYSMDRGTKTHCKRGHTLGDAYVNQGKRVCRTCTLERNRAWRVKRKLLES